MKPLITILTAFLTVASPALALVEGEFLYQFGSFQGLIGYPAVNEEGQIVVGNPNANQILVFDSCGNFLNEIQTQQVATRSAAVNFDGQILALTSTGAGIAYVFSPQGELLFQFGQGILGIDCSGACFNEAGEMFLCDTNNHRIVVFDRCGNFLFTFGQFGSPTGSFIVPLGVCTDIEGNIYVSDIGNYRVQVFNPNGEFLFSFGSQGSQPGQFMNNFGVAISPFGEIAVADKDNQRVQIFDECGNLLKIIKDSHTTSPYGVAFNEDGILYITDQNSLSVLAYR